MLVDHLRTDVRFALRFFARSPGFTVVALTTLSVGIASIATIFTFINAAYFRRLPYAEATRTVALSQDHPDRRTGFSELSLLAAREIRAISRSFERVAVYQDGSGLVILGNQPRQVRLLRVDTAFFPIFRLRPQIGRLLLPEDIVGNAASVVISDELWRSAFGMDSSVVGTIVRVNDREMRVVGVLPAGFGFPYQTRAIVPLVEPADSVAKIDTLTVSALARLRPGVSRQTAQAEMDVIGRRLLAAHARRGMSRIVVREEMLDRRSQQFAPFPGLFLGAAAIVLLTACSNVGTLFLVRTAERRGEMAVRAALGASTRRLFQQVMTESFILSASASVIGGALSMAMVRLSLSAVPTAGFPSWYRIDIDWRVLAFLVFAAMIVTSLVGLTPSREGSLLNLVAALKTAGDVGVARSGVARRSRTALALQLSLSFVLSTGATLLLRTYQNIERVDLGYPADQIGVVHALFDESRYPDAGSRSSAADAISREALTLPNVELVAMRGQFTRLRSADTIGTRRPLVVGPQNDFRVFADRDTSRALGGFPRILVVSGDYFKLLRLGFRDGRNFTAVEGDATSPYVIVSAVVARSLWGSARATGKQLQFGAVGTPLNVVGVVDDVRDLQGSRMGLRADPRADIYFSTNAALSAHPEILFSSRGDVTTMRTALVNLVHKFDPNAVILRDITLASQIDQKLFDLRLFGALLGSLAGIALLLAMIGLYGVASYTIVQRTKEIGLRLAVGGSPRAVAGLVLMQTLRVVAIALVVGTVLALAASRLLRGFLFGVTPVDPTTYLGVMLVFGVVATIACYLPARRVSRVDPLIALRTE